MPLSQTQRNQAKVLYNDVSLGRRKLPQLSDDELNLLEMWVDETYSPAAPQAAPISKEGKANLASILGYGLRGFGSGATFGLSEKLLGKNIPEADTGSERLAQKIGNWAGWGVPYGVSLRALRLLPLLRAGGAATAAPTVRQILLGGRNVAGLQTVPSALKEGATHALAGAATTAGADLGEGQDLNAANVLQNALITGALGGLFGRGAARRARVPAPAAAVAAPEAAAVVSRPAAFPRVSPLANMERLAQEQLNPQGVSRMSSQAAEEANNILRALVRSSRGKAARRGGGGITPQAQSELAQENRIPPDLDRLTRILYNLTEKVGPETVAKPGAMRIAAAGPVARRALKLQPPKSAATTPEDIMRGASQEASFARTLASTPPIGPKLTTSPTGLENVVASLKKGKGRAGRTAPSSAAPSPDRPYRLESNAHLKELAAAGDKAAINELATRLANRAARKAKKTGGAQPTTPTPAAPNAARPYIRETNARLKELAETGDRGAVKELEIRRANRLAKGKSPARPPKPGPGYVWNEKEAQWVRVGEEGPQAAREASVRPPAAAAAPEGIAIPEYLAAGKDAKLWIPKKGEAPGGWVPGKIVSIDPAQNVIHASSPDGKVRYKYPLFKHTKKGAWTVTGSVQPPGGKPKAPKAPKGPTLETQVQDIMGGVGEPAAPAQVQMMITRDMRQRLYDLGHSKASVDAMKPEQAAEILKAAGGVLPRAQLNRPKVAPPAKSPYFPMRSDQLKALAEQGDEGAKAEIARRIAKNEARKAAGGAAKPSPVPRATPAVPSVTQDWMKPGTPAQVYLDLGGKRAWHDATIASVDAAQNEIVFALPNKNLIPMPITYQGGKPNKMFRLPKAEGKKVPRKFGRNAKGEVEQLNKGESTPLKRGKNKPKADKVAEVVAAAKPQAPVTVSQMDIEARRTWAAGLNEAQLDRLYEQGRLGNVLQIFGESAEGTKAQLFARLKKAIERWEGGAPAPETPI